MPSYGVTPKRRGHDVIGVLRNVDHENVVHTYSAEELSKFKQLSSLEEIYRGYQPMRYAVHIGKTEMCLQIASGLKYLHERGIVHGNVSPGNIRLSGNTVKIGGFDSSHKMNEQGMFIVEEFGSDSYLAPETLNVIHERERSPSGAATLKVTHKIDVFAAGCTFFFVATDGFHPFGSTALTIPQNIHHGNQVNRKMLPDVHPLCGMIQSMLRSNPTDRVDLDSVIKWLTFVLQGQREKKSVDWKVTWFNEYLPESLRMTCDITKRVGSINRRIGGHVFAGTYLWTDVAVKRIPKNELSQSRPFEPLESLKTLNNDNLLKLYHFKTDDDFVFLALELCIGSLGDYYRGECPGPIPSKADGFKQMANGVAYIHSKGLVHAELRPTNVLITRTQPVQLKLSDFGVRSPEIATKSNSSGDGKFSKEFFFAPELLRSYDANCEGDQVNAADVLCDVFSLGCLFYTYATKGDHPFLEKDKSIFFITTNIIAGRTYFHSLDDTDDKKLIAAMIQDRKNRISLEEVVNIINSLA